MGPSIWKKLRLLVWKNWLLAVRRKKQFTIEMLSPIFFTLLLVLIRVLVHPTPYDKPSRYPAQNIDNLDDLKKKFKLFSSSCDIKKWGIAYSPQNQYLEKIIINAAHNKLNISVEAFTNAKELKDGVARHGLIAGVAFDDQLSNITTYPHKLSYTLRFPTDTRNTIMEYNEFRAHTTWQTNNIFPIYNVNGPRNVNMSDGGLPPGYIKEGFAAIQHAISYSFIELVSGRDDLPGIQMRRFPYPPFILDNLLEGLQAFIPLMVVLSFGYPCGCIVEFITTEKEKQLKEVMKIMGLANWLHWTAWFVKCFISVMISMGIITILLKVHWVQGAAVLTYTHWSCLLFFLTVYAFAVITYGFMISTFFSKGTTAGAATGSLWFIMYLPFSFTSETYGALYLSQKLGIGLFCNSAMAYGVMLILQFEGTGEGLQWNNMWRPVSVDDDMHVGHTIIMLILDSCIHMLIALYIEQIFPGDFGVPKKWYYPLTKEFWCGEQTYTGVTDSHYINGDSSSNNNGGGGHQSQENFESDPTDKLAGIQIKGLRKVFGNKAAVCGLTLNMYENDITVLLGHNGAGKSTTMSMLTGMFPPTSGTAIVNGYDLRTSIEKARSSLGLCPQHNILYDELTVSEHIIFYSLLKGVPNDKIDEEVKKYTKILGLESKVHTQSTKLSGGMKRKLSVGVALCGDSKVVLLDEPSSGMDSASRRSLWDLLQQEKHGRTILISTHFMDEADVLGDRIAIMSGGELKCCGTSFFLKKKFGVGYNLICVKRKSCDSKNVTELLRKYVPDIQSESDIGAELSYQLPYKYSKVFKDMLENLENTSDELGLSGYGISITTMEEVFMKVGAQRDERNGHILPELEKDNESISTCEECLAEGKQLLKGKTLLWNQWKAMMYKKVLTTIRNLAALFAQNFTPIFLISMTIIIIRHEAIFLPLRALKISLSSYSQSVCMLEMNDTDTSNEKKQIGLQYKNIVESYGPSHKFIQIDNTTQGFEDYILEKSKTMLVWINSRYFAAATINHENVTAWFNNQAYHTVPLSLNLVHNAILKAVVSPDYNIDVTNYPLPHEPGSRFEQMKIGRTPGFQLALNISFCMSIVSSLYIMFLIKERVTRAKLLQLVGGLRIPIFWISSFIWDYFTYILTALISVLTLAAFQEEGWSTFEELGRTFIVLLLFGFSVLPVTYIMSFAFKEPALGLTRLALLNVITGMAFLIIVFVMGLNIYNLKHISNVLKWVLMIFPHFTLGNALNKMYNIFQIKKSCKLLCDTFPSSISCNRENQCRIASECCAERHYFGWENDGIGPDILYMICSGVVVFAILLIKEMDLIDDFLHILGKWKTPKVYREGSNDDEDVRAEKIRVSAMTEYEIESKNLILDHVTKYYEKFLAVNQISVAVNHSECFGLLGVNGAGKTTTFKMLTGDEKISSGDAYVKGINLRTKMKHVYQEIGYCPQFDGLLEELTGREILKIFCYLRGIPDTQIYNTIMTLAKGLGFLQHIDKRVSAYSGGNKRKLSTAIALMGPSVIYLDEPTTGMDPGARRQLWNMVIRVRDSGKSVVLTSHSMEECEALCTRLAIMVNGEFKCLGSLQHLKNKFSKGFILKIKLRTIDEQKQSQTIHHDEEKSSSNDLIQLNRLHKEVEELKRFMETSFSAAVIKEQYRNILTFHIPIPTIRWSHTFGLLEDNKERLNVEDYSISQTTLEEIFLDFAKQQKEDPRQN